MKPAVTLSAPPPDYFQQPTAYIATDTYDSSVQPGGILVISFCGNSKEEKKDVKWLLKNMKWVSIYFERPQSLRNKNDGKKLIYSLEDVVADSNVEETAKDAFQKVGFITIFINSYRQNTLSFV